MGASAADLASGSRTPLGTLAGPTSALARRALQDSRIRTIGFAYLFLAVSYVQPAAFRHAYPSISDRVAFARSFADNKAIRLFYGEPHNLLTVGGYSAWRVGGTLAIFAAVAGLLAAVRALRAEEESGRTELVLAGAVPRLGAYVAALLAIIGLIAAPWLAELAGLVVGGLRIGPSAYLALGTASVAVVCAGIGSLVSQLAPTRRLALELGGLIVGIAFLLRVVADTVGGLGWMRWATPLGWAEELRPFTGAHPVVLLVPVAASALLLAASWKIASRRDVGSGVLPARESAEPKLRLLSSPTAYALRCQAVTLAVWTVSAGAFAFILGIISKSISTADVSKSLEREIAKVGAGSIFTPRGYLGFTFIFFVFALSLFACAQVGAARREELSQQLETLLALPVSRRRWLTGRLALAAAATVAISMTIGFFGWAGAASEGLAISLPRLLEAGANCIPVAILFMGIAALAYALAPRGSGGIAYGLATAAFLWQLFGSLLGVPRWLVEVTPFEHVGLVPAAAFRPIPAIVMVVLGLVASGVAVLAFERRDLISG